MTIPTGKVIDKTLARSADIKLRLRELDLIEQRRKRFQPEHWADVRLARAARLKLEGKSAWTA